MDAPPVIQSRQAGPARPGPGAPHHSSQRGRQTNPKPVPSPLLAARPIEPCPPPLLPHEPRLSGARRQQERLVPPAFLPFPRVDRLTDWKTAAGLDDNGGFLRGGARRRPLAKAAEPEARPVLSVFLGRVEPWQPLARMGSGGQDAYSPGGGSGQAQPGNCFLWIYWIRCFYFFSIA